MQDKYALNASVQQMHLETETQGNSICGVSDCGWTPQGICWFHVRISQHEIYVKP